MAKSGRTVIRSTNGRIALSDEAIQFKLSVGRSVRYQYYRLSKKVWCCWVCGPFHSRYYGVSSFGITKVASRDNLSDNLARNFGFIGTLLFSDVDTADTVGIPYDGAITIANSACPISLLEAVGSAGR